MPTEADPPVPKGKMADPRTSGLLSLSEPTYPVYYAAVGLFFTNLPET